MRLHQRRPSTHDDHAFQTIYQNHARRVHAFVRRRARPTDVDDIVSETFLTAWRRRDNLPEDPDELCGWLLRTAHYTILNAHRSSRRRAQLIVKLKERTPVDLVAPGGDIHPDEISDPLIHTVFHQLPQHDQIILLLVAWDECNAIELASFLHCTPGTARARLARARKRFRDSVLDQHRDPKHL